jgi:hypothetical protein
MKSGYLFAILLAIISLDGQAKSNDRIKVECSLAQNHSDNIVAKKEITLKLSDYNPEEGELEGKLELTVEDAEIGKITLKNNFSLTDVSDEESAEKIWWAHSLLSLHAFDDSIVFAPQSESQHLKNSEKVKLDQSGLAGLKRRFYYYHCSAITK